MVAFYNQGDQAIYDSGQYFIPQEQYRLSYNAPTIEEEQESIGIPNTNSFRNFSNSDNRYFSGSGNAFGYGSAIKPADPSVITSGPYAGQSGYYGSPNYTGGLPGNVQQSGPGRYFDYGQVNKDGESVFYKDYSIQPKKQFPGFIRAGAAFLPGGNFLLNLAEKRMNPTKGLTASEIDKNYMGSYGIAGLTNAQKMMYDNLASKGMLFQGSGGLKTLTGKNFAGKGYLEDQLDIYNNKFADMSEEEIEELKNNPKKQFQYKQYLESSAMYKTNKAQEAAAKDAAAKDAAAKEQAALNAAYQTQTKTQREAGGGGGGQFDGASSKAEYDSDPTGFSGSFKKGGLASIL